MYKKPFTLATKTPLPPLAPNIRVFFGSGQLGGNLLQLLDHLGSVPRCLPPSNTSAPEHVHRGVHHVLVLGVTEAPTQVQALVPVLQNWGGIRGKSFKTTDRK